MYEDVKNHPAFIAFGATPTPVSETQAAKEEELDKADEHNDAAAQ